MGQLLDGLILLASAAMALAGVVALYLVWLDETPWWGFFVALATLAQLALVPALLGVSRNMRQITGRFASIALLSLLSYSAYSGLHIVERLNVGVHVCTTAHYDHSRVACSEDDTVLSSLDDAKVVAFGPSGRNFTADSVQFYVQQKGSSHACTADPIEADDSAKSVSMKVVDLFSMCHITPASGTTWGVTGIQPDKFLGSTEFTYQPQ